MPRIRWITLPIALFMLLTACGADDATDGGDGAEATGPTDQAVDVATPSAEASASPEEPSEDASANDEDGAPAGDASDSITVAIGGDEGTLTPFTYRTGYPGFTMLAMVYDSLLVLDAANEVQPLLATDLEISEDGLTYTMPLAEGVMWHDGEPFDAADVAFSIDFYTANPTNIASGAALVSDVSTEGNTVTFTLDEPNPDLQIDLLARMPIIPEHVWADVDDVEAAPIDAAVGTGPYRVVEFVTDQRYRFEANADYALGTPTVAEVVMPIIPEPATAFAAVQTGEITSTAEALEAQLVEQFAAVDGVEVFQGPSFSPSLLQFNTERAGLDRPEVRRAIAQAIDVQELVDVVRLGQAVPGQPGFLHPESPLNAVETAYDTDPAAAAAALDELGATPGADGIRVLDGQPLAFELLTYADDPDRVRTAELVAESLTAIGIDVTVQTQDADAVDEQVWPGFDVANGRDYDMAMWSWSAPVSLTTQRFGGLVASDLVRGSLNIGGLVDDGIDATVAELDAAVDPAVREELVGTLQEQIADQLPFVTLYWPDTAYAAGGEFDGWVFQAGTGIFSRPSFVS